MGSSWNFGGFANGASTDGNGHLVVTGKSEQTFRKTSPVYAGSPSSPCHSRWSIYRLTLDISEASMSAGSMMFDASGGATGGTRVAALKIERKAETTSGTGEEGDPIESVPAYPLPE